MEWGGIPRERVTVMRHDKYVADKPDTCQTHGFPWRSEVCLLLSHSVGIDRVRFSCDCGFLNLVQDRLGQQ